MHTPRAQSKQKKSAETWCVDLSECFRVPGLPSVWCERMQNEDVVLGRAANHREELANKEWMNLKIPVKLKTHSEKKPWGREIWYTGIEKRGVCEVESHTKEKLSLPSYLSLLSGKQDCENGQLKAPSLLKILDPLPEPERGCLYIELHKEKWETYVVTSVDSVVWPNGIGEVIFGFSESKLTDYNGDKDIFLAALQEQISEYEKVRRQIDADVSYLASGVWAENEKKLWQSVRSYFGIRKVRVGDVIEVPPFTPHSLQNGVRVVEFQTPTYERLILAFNQKVQTQDHWDTAEALSQTHFNVPQLHSETQIKSTPEACLSEKSWQCIVDFPGFKVHRMELAAEQSVPLGLASGSHVSLLFVVLGSVLVESESHDTLLELGSEEAALFPEVGLHVRIKAANGGPAVVLFV